MNASKAGEEKSAMKQYLNRFQRTIYVSSLVSLLILVSATACGGTWKTPSVVTPGPHIYCNRHPGEIPDEHEFNATFLGKIQFSNNASSTVPSSVEISNIPSGLLPRQQESMTMDVSTDLGQISSGQDYLITIAPTPQSAHGVTVLNAEPANQQVLENCNTGEARIISPYSERNGNKIIYWQVGTYKLGFSDSTFSVDLAQPLEVVVQFQGAINPEVLSAGNVQDAVSLQLPPNPTPSQQAQVLILQYYNDINKDDYEAAYKLWGTDFQSKISYRKFAGGFAHTLNDNIMFGDVVPRSDGAIQVAVTIYAHEETASGIVIQPFRGYYIVGQENGKWMLLSGSFV